MGKLKGSGIETVKALGRLECFQIERILSRNPPFGQELVRMLAKFPLLTLSATILGPYQPKSEVAPLENLWLARFVLGYDNKDMPAWKDKKPWTTLLVEGADGRLVWFWRGTVRSLSKGKDLVVKIHGAKDESLVVTFACEEIVGTTVRCILEV